jgi:hypothetical protein
VDVHVTNGVVTLTREVPNAQVKVEAEQEACSVAGVTRGINNRQVKALPSRSPTRPIASRAGDRLGWLCLRDAGRPRPQLRVLKTREPLRAWSAPRALRTAFRLPAPPAGTMRAHCNLDLKDLENSVLGSFGVYSL